MTTITFELIGEMEKYAEDIDKFVQLMVQKLHKNVHKGRWENMHYNTAIGLLEKEVIELRIACRTHQYHEVPLEAADVANFAMIIAAIMRDSHGQ